MHQHPLRLIITDLEVLYDKLPVVQCIGCGECCVSPTCTLVEFIYLLRQLDQCLTISERDTFLKGKVETDGRYDGNIKCKLVSGNRCSVHKIRTGACRLFGIPAVESMNIPDLVRCKHGRNVEPKPEDHDFIKDWLKKLVMLNRRLYPIGEPPYFLTGLSLECWIDIMVVDYWEQPFFRNLQNTICTMTGFVNSGTLIQRTGIERKIKVIDEFNSIIECGDVKRLTELLIHIRDDFPLTGSWYYEEVNLYLKHIATFHECGENVSA